MFSLRVYDRALSRAEVAHNHRVDALRFRNAPAFEASAAVCVRAVDSSAYVQDGLVAQLDGRCPTRNGNGTSRSTGCGSCAGQGSIRPSW